MYDSVAYSHILRDVAFCYVSNVKFFEVLSRTGLQASHVEKEQKNKETYFSFLTKFMPVSYYNKIVEEERLEVRDVL